MGHVVIPKTDFISEIENPPIDSFALGFDTDGDLKKKDSEGNVSAIGGGGGLPYLFYSAFITAFGSDTPAVDTELYNNTGGAFTYSRTGPGEYMIQSAGWSSPFTAGKTSATLHNPNGSTLFMKTSVFNANQIAFYVTDIDGNPSDGSLYLSLLEIKIYP